ncbi:uncharacterized protein [Phyllobates terribilis]|uniref:uncharacterized protein n=1 Tax=Phyllobates terribilis TaxID=111132 RepID=UPI003CCB6B48
MDRDKDKMAERILHLTLEILFRLTGEDYILVKTSSERCQAPLSEGWGTPPSPISGPPPQPLIQKDIYDQKILELTYKMIELLTGEVPIRYQDVTVYFSMEEWEYLEGHKDLYEDIMMEVPQPLTSPDPSSKRTTPERCPRPLLPQDCKQENPNVPQDHQGKDLTPIDTTETYVKGDEQWKEEILTDNRTVLFLADDCTTSSEGHLIFSAFAADNCSSASGTCEEPVIFTDVPQTHLRKILSPDPFEKVLSSASSKTNMQTESKRSAEENEIAYIGEKSFSCSEGGKYYSSESSLVTHQRSHTGEKRYPCLECGKCFTGKSYLVKHHRIHTGEKLLFCTECGKCFNQKGNFVAHQRIHTGEKPFFCSDCGKCFNWKANFDRHQLTHSGKKPFSCSECGKNFISKSRLVIHQRIHTGYKPYSCSECGKGFRDKSELSIHQITHTGAMPFSCLNCGKGFSRKSNLVAHQRTHTGK